jgi:hypothetical protein
MPKTGVLYSHGLRLTRLFVAMLFVAMLFAAMLAETTVS